MKCPNCSALAMDTEIGCPVCQRPFPKGPTAWKIAHITGVVFGVMMTMIVFFFLPAAKASTASEKVAAKVADDFTEWLVVGVAVIVGEVVGLIGAFLFGKRI